MPQLVCFVLWWVELFVTGHLPPETGHHQSLDLLSQIFPPHWENLQHQSLQLCRSSWEPTKKKETNWFKKRIIKKEMIIKFSLRNDCGGVSFSFKWHPYCLLFSIKIHSATGIFKWLSWYKSKGNLYKILFSTTPKVLYIFNTYFEGLGQSFNVHLAWPHCNWSHLIIAVVIIKCYCYCVVHGCSWCLLLCYLLTWKLRCKVRKSEYFASATPFKVVPGFNPQIVFRRFDWTIPL